LKPSVILSAAALLAALNGLSGVAEAGSVSPSVQPSQTAAYYSPYLADSPVFGASPYRTGPVLGGIFYDGDSSEPIGGPVFTPIHGITCDARRHACWSQTGIDRLWTSRFFGLRN